MNVTLDMDSEAFAQSVGAELAVLKVPCQAAMAMSFAEDAYNSFGVDGQNRMSEWPALSMAYALKKHGGDTTPTLVLSGELRESIRNGIDATNEDAATVSTDVPYADLMQNGGVNANDRVVPARPFFPIVGDEVWQPTADKCVDACRQVLEERLR